MKAVKKKPVTICGKTFGGGKLLSVISVCSVDEDSLKRDLQAAFQSGADAVELKLTRFFSIQNIPQLLEREACVHNREKPLFLCLNQEGNDKRNSDSEKLDVVKACIAGKLIDVVDIPWDADDAFLHAVQENANTHGVQMILSKHDYLGITSPEDVVRCAAACERKGADMVKLFYMADNDGDLARAAKAAKRLNEELSIPFCISTLNEVGLMYRVYADRCGNDFTYSVLNEGGEGMLLETFAQYKAFRSLLGKRLQSVVQYNKKGKTFGGKDYYACLMIKEGTRAAILEAADTIMQLHPDLVEWRLDYCVPMEDTDFSEQTLAETARCLAERLGGVPLLITFRIKEEGGFKKYSRELRLRMAKAVINTGHIDFIDIEIGSDQAYIDEIKAACTKYDTKVILSYHNWEIVPDESYLLEKVQEAMDKGADMPKLYLVVNSYEQALRVMATAVKVRKETIVKTPMIFCGMGHGGLLTRVMGGEVANDFGYFTITGIKGGIEEDVTYYRQLQEAFGI